VPDAELVVEVCLGVQNNVASRVEERVIRENGRNGEGVGQHGSGG